MIEIGDFVRFKSGKIEKIKDNDEVEISNIFSDSISKHSKNIIDLIEVGDFVNGKRVIEKENVLLSTNVRSIDRSGYNISIPQYGTGIKTILTHEQYEEHCFKVEE